MMGRKRGSWPRKFPVVQVEKKRDNPGRWSRDLDPSAELPWNVSLWIVEQMQEEKRRHGKKA